MVDNMRRQVKGDGGQWAMVDNGRWWEYSRRKILIYDHDCSTHYH